MTKTVATDGAKGARIVRFNYDDEVALARDADLLLKLISQRIDSGVQFLPGQTFQYGTVVSKLVEVGSEVVELHEQTSRVCPSRLCPR